MSEVKRYWQNEYEYKRILEILDDYWLTSKDEVRVMCEMHFLKGNGEFQKKQITWLNPNLKRRSTPHNNFELTTMAEIEESPLDRFWGECVRFTILRYDKVLRTDVYAWYEEFCKGEQIVPVSRNSFYSYMRGKGVAETTIKGYRYFNGIALKKRKYQKRENRGDRQNGKHCLV